MFDLSLIEDKDVKGKLIWCSGELKKERESAVGCLVNIGRILATAQEAMAVKGKNGSFIKWAASEGFSKTNAYRLINVFHSFGASKRSNLERLDHTSIYLLSEPTTPPDAVKEAMKKAEKGEYLAYSEVKELIAKHKPESNGHAEEPEQPKTCLEGGEHSWVNDGNGERYCETCKEEHPDNPQPVLDGLKGAVPESLQEIFEQTSKWEQAMESVSQVKKLITGLKDHPAAGCLDVTETERLLSQARTNLKFAMPFTECVKCRRKPKKDCPHCKGTGWLNQATYKACASDGDMLWLEHRK